MGQKLAVLDSAYGMNAKCKFDHKVIEEGWNASNQITQAYYEENNDKLQKAAGLLRDFSDPDFLEKGTVKQLL